MAGRDEDVAELEAAVRALPPGWSGRFYRSVSSTQDVARAAAAAGAPGRRLFVADYQAAGRGRQGRSWLASPGTGLLVSILLRQPGAPRPWRSTSLASVALAEAIERVCPGLRPQIKWPNDLLLPEGRKVAGVLAEATFDGQAHTLIVGVGVNVGTPAAELAELGRSATSLLVASGGPVRRGRLLLAFAARLDWWLGRSEDELQASWQARLWGKGQSVQLAELGVQTEVVVLGAEPDGALRVRLPDGSVRRTTTGELIL